MNSENSLPIIYDKGEPLSLKNQIYENVMHSNDKKNRQIINDIEGFDLKEEFWKNKYTPLGRLPKLAEYKQKLDMLIYEKFNNPENITARRKIFLNKKCKIFNNNVDSENKCIW